jgi:hypothetical protein
MDYMPFERGEVEKGQREGRRSVTALAIGALLLFATLAFVNKVHAAAPSLTPPSVEFQMHPGSVATASEDPGPGECESELAKLPERAH